MGALKDPNNEYLFDPQLLKGLDWDSVLHCLNPRITNESPGEPWLLVRPLYLSDYSKGYLQILSQLTSVGNVSQADFEDGTENNYCAGYVPRTPLNYIRTIKRLVLHSVSCSRHRPVSSLLGLIRQFRNMRKAGGYYITVIEDTRINKIIGASSLITEFKIIHDCSLRGRLEDVVVNNTYRGKQLGKLIVLTVSLLAKKLGCYKMSLDCKDNLIPFYKSIGYKLESGNANSMTIRYEESSKPVDPS